MSMKQIDIMNKNAQEMLDLVNIYMITQEDVVFIHEEESIVVLHSKGIIIKETNHYLMGPEWNIMDIEDYIKELVDWIQDENKEE